MLLQYAVKNNLLKFTIHVIMKKIYAFFRQYSNFPINYIYFLDFKICLANAPNNYTLDILKSVALCLF